jgi:hypothetical protein
VQINKESLELLKSSNIMAKDDTSVPMDTETVENPNSFGSRASSFMAQFFLFLVTVGLAVLLVLQLIVIATVEPKAKNPNETA